MRVTSPSSPTSRVHARADSPSLVLDAAIAVVLAVVLTAVAAATPACAAAQAADTPPAIGFWAGLTSATFRGSDAPGPTYLAGFSAGAFYQWSFAPHFALQPELQYTQKGSDELDATSTGVPYAMHIRLSYIEVPLLLRAEAPAIGAFTPFVLAGPEVAFKAGCGLVVSGLPGNFTCSSLQALPASVDYGGIAGAGVSVKIAGRRYGVSVRYDAGVANAFSGNNAKNRAVSVLLGTVFR